MDRENGNYEPSELNEEIDRSMSDNDIGIAYSSVPQLSQEQDDVVRWDSGPINFQYNMFSSEDNLSQAFESGLNMQSDPSLGLQTGQLSHSRSHGAISQLAGGVIDRPLSGSRRLSGSEDKTTSPKNEYFLPDLDVEEEFSSGLLGSERREYDGNPIGSQYENFMDFHQQMSAEALDSQRPRHSQTTYMSNGAHPYGEHPSRTLFIRNISSQVAEREIRNLFEAYGPIRSVYSQCKHRGFVMISYYDIRHARNALKALQGRMIKKRRLDIHYSIPKENPSEKDQNQGTLVIFNLDPATTNDELIEIFGAYGEVKEIRETPNKRNHRFIEFYDVRDADGALRMLNKTEIRDKRIKLEPSRPGGKKGYSQQPRQAHSPDRAVFNELDIYSTAQQPRMSMYGFTDSFTSIPDAGIPRSQSYDGIRQTFANNDIGQYAQRGGTRSAGERNTQFAIDVDKIVSGEDSRTTVMIRNIPNKYTQKTLLAEVDVDFQGAYDFFYLPIDFKNKCNVGYAFIDFINALSIVQFIYAFNGKKWDRFNSEKICEITYARIQGKSALIAHFQNSSLMNEDRKCQPLIFRSEGPNVGDAEPFPMGGVLRKSPSAR